MNWIDFVAIIPFYIDIAARGSNIPGLSVLRVLRLARVFRCSRFPKNSVSLLAQTMMESAPATLHPRVHSHHLSA